VRGALKLSQARAPTATPAPTPRPVLILRNLTVVKSLRIDARYAAPVPLVTARMTPTPVPNITSPLPVVLRIDIARFRAAPSASATPSALPTPSVSSTPAASCAPGSAPVFVGGANVCVACLAGTFSPGGVAS